MMVEVFDSNRARTRWREILDKAHVGDSDVVIERYGKPVAVVIAYKDYVALQDELDDLRATRRAAAIYEAWQRDPRLARPYAEFREELVTEGVLDADPRPLDDTPESGR
jgi:prevent-host-death family protein